MSRQVLFLPQTQREVPLRPLWKIKWQSSPIFCLPPPYRERLKDPKPFSKLLPLPSAQRARCRIPTTIKDRFALQLLVEEGVFLFLKRLQGKYSLKKKIQRVKRPPNCWIKNNSRLLPLKKKEIKGKKITKNKKKQQRSAGELRAEKQAPWWRAAASILGVSISSLIPAQSPTVTDLSGGGVPACKLQLWKILRPNPSLLQPCFGLSSKTISWCVIWLHITKIFFFFPSPFVT